MNRPYLTPLKILGCMMLVFVGMAEAGVASCDEKTECILATDVIYDNVSDEVPVQASESNRVVEDTALSTTENAIDSSAVNEGVWAQNRAQTRSIALDVETMRAAKSSVLASDVALHSLPPSNLVALDKRNSDWFDFH